MSERRVAVGAEVRFELGGRTVTGKVREDRGPIGIGGRRLYLITYELDKGTSYQVELPRAHFEVVTPQREPA
jgi:hypothetical protein